MRLVCGGELQRHAVPVVAQLGVQTERTHHREQHLRAFAQRDLLQLVPHPPSRDARHRHRTDVVDDPVRRSLPSLVVLDELRPDVRDGVLRERHPVLALRIRDRVVLVDVDVEQLGQPVPPFFGLLDDAAHAQDPLAIHPPDG